MTQVDPPPVSTSFARNHLDEAIEIARLIDCEAVEAVVGRLAKARAEGGRVFFIGVGGSAANCSHAVNDFRKLTQMEAYAPTDNVAELTARTNDEGWDTVFSGWLQVSRLQPKDVVFVMSVGGGDLERNVSPNLVQALRYAKEIGSTVVGIVSRDGGYTAKVADECVIIPTVNKDAVTPHAEAFQAVVWHLMVTHPLLKAAPTKWESLR